MSIESILAQTYIMNCFNKVFHHDRTKEYKDQITLCQRRSDTTQTFYYRND